MRRKFPPLVSLCLLLAACGSNPRKDFDTGVSVHFILVRTRAPEKDVTLEPVFTVGEAVVRAPAVTFGPDHALAQESAVLRVARDPRARVSFYDPATGTRARATFDTRHELWVVVDLTRIGEPTILNAYERPPNRGIQEWIPLAELAD